VEVIPAIDLLGGRVVRLSRGSYDAVTDYGDDPVAVALRWQAEGARRIHVVDLDAARQGRPVQTGVLARLVAGAGVDCQVAGGLRDALVVREALNAGADRVVLGSAFIADPDLAARLIEAHGVDRIVAALDVRDGQAVGDGWVAGARAAPLLDHAAVLHSLGIRWFAVTAIARDGALEGPDLELLEALRGALPGAAIIASGGIASLGDIRALAERGFAAAIVGRALYEGVFTLVQAVDVVAGTGGPDQGSGGPDQRSGGPDQRSGGPVQGSGSVSDRHGMADLDAR
jgi:phosphoribosylformimino-5-aminoimidazole carboxamide ribotide isomerase